MRKILVILAIFGVLGIVAGIYIFLIIRNVDYKYTGEEMFGAINEYRVSQNIPALELDPKLCDNLVERYWAVKEPANAHRGFEEWARAEGIADNPKYGIIGEMFVVDVSTPDNAITWWLGSPGHKSTLEMREMAYGCVYASDGTVVVVMATSSE